MRQSYWKQVCLVSQNIPHTKLYRYKCICNCKSKKKIVRKKRCFVIITKFQNMRCFCTSEGCNSKATYPQGCKIFVRLLIFSKIFLIQISNFKNQNIISHEGKRSREKRWNHSSCTFHNLDCTRILPSIRDFQHI